MLPFHGSAFRTLTNRIITLGRKLKNGWDKCIVTFSCGAMLWMFNAMVDYGKAWATRVETSMDTFGAQIHSNDNRITRLETYFSENKPEKKKCSKKSSKG